MLCVSLRMGGFPYRPSLLFSGGGGGGGPLCCVFPLHVDTLASPPSSPPPPVSLPRWLSPARESCSVTNCEILFPSLRASVQPEMKPFPRWPTLCTCLSTLSIRHNSGVSLFPPFPVSFSLVRYPTSPTHTHRSGM